MVIGNYPLQIKHKEYMGAVAYGFAAETLADYLLGSYAIPKNDCSFKETQGAYDYKQEDEEEEEFIFGPDGL